MKRKCECIMITAVLLFLIALLMYPVQGAGQAMPLGQTSSGTDTHKPGQTTFGTAGGTAGNTGAGNGKDYQILDHSMASKIDESTYQVIARSSAFRPWDSKAYSWVSLGNVDRAHHIDWNWYSPDGGLYDALSEDIPSPVGDPWQWYNVYTYIDIAGDDAANMPGLWHVDVMLDGQKILTEEFTMLSTGSGGSNGNSAIDIFGRTWNGNTGLGNSGEGNSGQYGFGTGEMHGGCYTDPSTGRTICVDYFGSPYGQQIDQGSQLTQGGLSGGCYQDPMTGEIICVDMAGETGGQSFSQRGCFTDESTGEVICMD